MLPNLPIAFLKSFRKGFMLPLILLISINIHATNYYVNDSSRFEDIYTSAIGNDMNDGKSSNSPKLTLLAAYNSASAGDVIYVDTGNYPKDAAADLILSSNSKKIQIIRAGTDTTVYQKIPLPSNQKVSPAIFYVVNDKPVEREAYMQQLQNTARKN